MKYPVFLDKGTVVFEGDLQTALNSGNTAVTEFFAKAKGKI
jgi:hypothetical protein